MRPFALCTRGAALSFLALFVALSTACGGGGDDSGGGANTQPPAGSAPPPAQSTGIGSAGGTVTEASGAKVVVPAGALATQTDIQVTQVSTGAPALPAGLTSAGQIYAFTPHGTAFTKPVTITVPFDPASVPAGMTVALYKTNATLTEWQEVGGATVSGNTMVGDVTGFSDASVVQITPTLKTWHVETIDRKEQFRALVAPESNTGEVVDVGDRIGEQPFVPPGIPDDLLTYEIFSNKSGRTFWTMALAPHNAQTSIGTRATLTQTFYFKVVEQAPTLHFLITRAGVEAVDEGGTAAILECVWLGGGATEEDLKKDCNGHMVRAEADFRLEARTLDASGFLFRGQGHIEVSGVHDDFRFKVSGGAVEHALWSPAEFSLGGGTTGNTIFLNLIGSKRVDVPIESLTKGTIFSVEIVLTAKAINHIQGESFVGSILRDPLQEAGIDFETTGVAQIEPQPDVPLSLPPLTCPTGPNPDAGTLQFESTTLSTPEPSDSAAIVIERVGGTAGEVSVHVDTHDGSATAGSDYQAVSTEVRFADGEGGQRRIEVPIVDDDIEEPEETLSLTLSNVGGCAQLSATPTATLRVLDDDRPVTAPETHTVGGTVSGLVGSGLVLKDSFTGGSVTPSNGPFTLPDARLDATHYDVRVDTQPSNPVQQCTVANGSGVMAGANVTNVQVTCASLVNAGGLDPTFGTAGRAVTNIPFSSDVFDARLGMAMQSDGRILMVGGLTLVRFNTDGTVDTTFGSGGQVHVPFNGGAFDGAEDVAVQPDGKIVVVGVTDPGGQVGKDDFAVARFNADGTPDTTFGSGGKTSTDIAGSSDIARRVRIQPDGKIVVSGNASVVVSPTVAVREMALVRYNSDGTPDTTFSLDGKTTDSAGRSFNDARGLFLQSDGRIVLAGFTADNGAAAPTDVGLIRYWGDTHPGNALPGERDETFGAVGNGTVDDNLHLPSPEADDVVVTADGKVVVAGHASLGSGVMFVIAPFSSDGRLLSGAGLTQFSDQSDFPNSMLLQADGKIVVVGQSASNGANPDWAIVRYAGGAFAPDTSFGTEGKVTIDFFGGRDDAIGVVQQADGKLVVGGLARNGAAPVFALARLLP